MHSIELKPGREKLAFNYNPWVFSGAIKKINGSPEPGDVVQVYDHKGDFIAFGHYSPESKISVRLLDWNPGAVIDEKWYYDKIKKGLQLRKKIIDDNTDVYRLIYSEGDYIPGLIVDIFGPVAVLQALSAGIDAVKQRLAHILMEADPHIKTVYEKSDGDGRRMEGLPVECGILSGVNTGNTVEVSENSLKFLISLEGQKTGFYADQRQNRLKTALYAEGGRVLDVCSYTGGFSVYTQMQGASHTDLIDSSDEALQKAEINMKINNIDKNLFALHKGDAFEVLRRFRKEKKLYDLIILDPPKLAPSARDTARALRAYKDLNFQAMNLLEHGGILSTFSCSGHVTPTLFREAVSYAAKDAGYNMQILDQLTQAPDHPVRLSLPETEYLKGMILRKE